MLATCHTPFLLLDASGHQTTCLPLDAGRGGVQVELCHEHIRKQYSRQSQDILSAMTSGVAKAHSEFSTCHNVLAELRSPCESSGAPMMTGVTWPDQHCLPCVYVIAHIGYGSHKRFAHVGYAHIGFLHMLVVSHIGFLLILVMTHISS